jgi:hypothetical protein
MELLLWLVLILQVEIIEPIQLVLHPYPSPAVLHSRVLLVQAPGEQIWSGEVSARA